MLLLKLDLLDNILFFPILSTMIPKIFLYKFLGLQIIRELTVLEHTQVANLPCEARPLNPTLIIQISQTQQLQPIFEKPLLFQNLPRQSHMPQIKVLKRRITLENRVPHVRPPILLNNLFIKITRKLGVVIKHINI